MSLRNGLAGFLLILIVGGAGYLGYRYLVAPEHACGICGRELHPKLSGSLTLMDGSKIEVCCPRCGLHFKSGAPERVVRLQFEDSTTGEKIDGQIATYLEGSDAEFCHPDPETSPREPGVTYDRKFDRCLPSLLAFHSEGAAQAYHRQHGGRLLSYDEAMESVRHR